MARSNPARRRAVHLPLGRSDYAAALDLQRALHADRHAGKIADVVITTEHDPVITIGRTGSRANLLVSSDVLEREGVRVYRVERGGDVTYHGPGQLVVYPIVDLRPYGRDVKKYVERLEDASIRTLHTFGINGDRRASYPGAWVGQRKIASIGVYVKHWVTRHGLALNVGVNPAHFAMIRPCGLPVEAVSMNDLLEEPVAVGRVAAELLANLAERFAWRLEPADVQRLTGAGIGSPSGVD